MAYATSDDLKGLIPADWLAEATTDAAAGDAMAKVIQAAEDEVNNWISRQYPLPLDLDNALANAVPTLRHITRYIASYICYGRRGMQEQYPFIETLKSVRADLREIGKGEIPLFPTEQRLNTETVAVVTPNRVNGALISF